MRMWLVPPAQMCRKHLIGEHGELGLFVWCHNRGQRLDGYYTKGLIELHTLRQRHEELAAEMIQRGYKHNSPLPEFASEQRGCIDRQAAKAELVRRCPECRETAERQAPVFSYTQMKIETALRDAVDRLSEEGE